MAHNHKIVAVPEHEGPQVWNAEGSIFAECYDGAAGNNHSVYSSYHVLKAEGAEGDSSQHHDAIPKKNKRPWILIASTLIAFIIGIGAGIGVGYAIDKPGVDGSSSK